MIVAVRHPRPAIAEGVCYGQLDVGLAEPPEIGAAAIRDLLHGQTFDRIVSSPLSRAHSVAMWLADDLALPLALDTRIAEMSFGTWEGREWRDIARTEIDAWAVDPVGYRPGGGETVRDLLARVADAWRAGLDQGGRQLWITHAGPMRCLLSLSTGRPLGDCLAERFDYGATLTATAPEA